jgi:DnaJ-class molecular chaperone
MYELVPCPNQKCRGGRIHYHVGCDIWNECPTCNGSGFIKRGVIIRKDYSERMAEFSVRGYG